MPCTRNQFKTFAILFMVIDHVGAFLLGNNIFLRGAGRIAFPMFVFLLADGYRRTRNVRGYLGRLFLLYLLSIVPYSLACSGTLTYPAQNVYASLFLYLLLFCVLGHESIPKPVKVGAAGLSVFLAYMLRLEYSWYGVAVAVVMFYLPDLGTQNVATLLFGFSLLYGRLKGFPIQVFSTFCIGFIPYKGEFIESERPGKALSLISYLFYPIHLLFIALLKM